MSGRGVGAGPEPRYFIGDHEVDKNRFDQEVARRREASESRDRAKFRKRFLRYTALTVQAVNLVDAFLLGRRYQRRLLGELVVKIEPVSPLRDSDPGISLTIERSF